MSNKLSFPMLLPLLIVAFIFTSIRSVLSPFSMFVVVLPWSYILRPIAMSIDASPMCFAVHPLPFVYVSVALDQPSFPRSSVLVPVSYVLPSIGPVLHSFPVPESVHRPLSFVETLVLQHHGSFLYDWDSVIHFLISDKWSNVLLCFLAFSVFKFGNGVDF